MRIAESGAEVDLKRDKQSVDVSIDAGFVAVEREVYDVRTDKEGAHVIWLLVGAGAYTLLVVSHVEGFIGCVEAELEHKVALRSSWLVLPFLFKL